MRTGLRRRGFSPMTQPLWVCHIPYMSTGLLFWIIMLLLLILGFVAYWPRIGVPYWPLGMTFVTWVLLALLG